jgi:hypothetical protein
MQQYFNYAIIIIVLIAIPTMLIPKPIILYNQANKSKFEEKQKFSRLSEEEEVKVITKN